MIYNNLLYLLIVVFVLSSKSIPDTPQIALRFALPFFVMKGLCYYLAVGRGFRKDRIATAARYFTAERTLSILAIVSIAIDVYLLDCLFYFAKLPLTEKLPTLIDIMGLLLFFSYLVILWTAARPSYNMVFGGGHSWKSFVTGNLRNLFVFILPWLFLTILSDLLQLLKIPVLQEYLASPWGEPTIFITFFLILLVTFPLLVTRLWKCTTLPPSPLRIRIEQFCRRQGLGYADIMLWPLFEGRILTAGVMGFIKKFRYLLITPALLATMTPDEIEAVMAHETGHVKRFHLQLYLMLFLGFVVLAQLSGPPFFYLLTTSDLFYRAALYSNSDPVVAMTLANTVFTLLFLVLYFRFIFGFFMRNFERQADLYSLRTTGDSDTIVSVFEKIAALSGNIRDQPNWHHFSLTQRISFLRRCEAEPELIKKHHRKVYITLILYFVIVAIGAFSLWKIPTDFSDTRANRKFVEAVIKRQILAEPQNHLWFQYLGDLQQSAGKEAEAIGAYEKALTLAPNSPDTMNNLAWLLLTAADQKLLDPEKALALARQAAADKPAGYVLDTLAEAYWANNLPDKALAAERTAIAKDPANSDYYKKQMDKFSFRAYGK